MRQARRRGADEWRGLVQEWTRSGQTASVFAAKRGLSRQRLLWWRAKHKRDGTLEDRADELRLVPVQFESSEGTVEAEARAELAWELVGSAGHVLRVYERNAGQALRDAVAAVTRGVRR